MVRNAKWTMGCVTAQCPLTLALSATRVFLSPLKRRSAKAESALPGITEIR